MAIYESKLYAQNQETHLKERYIYGVERHGHIREHVELYNDSLISPSNDPYVENTLGKKRYELKSYNDNVHVVITDRKTYNDSEDAFEAVDVQTVDYYAFGMQMPGRTNYNEPIRFGYHGMEMDPEHKDDGNHYTTYFRQYDPRLGRWMSRDPESAMFPFESNYAANHNNPICFKDSEGDLPIFAPILLNALIGAGTDLTMQLVKNLFKKDKDGNRFNLKYAWQQIDWIDVGLAGIQGGIFPTTSVFSSSSLVSDGAKEVAKRTVKWITKTLMFFFDGKFEDVDEEDGGGRKFQIRMAFLDYDRPGWLKGKKKSDVIIDGISTAVGLGLLELDLQTSIFYEIAYEEGHIFQDIIYGYYIWHQIAYNFTSQIIEGLAKGLGVVGPFGEIIKGVDKKDEKQKELDSPEMSFGMPNMKGVQNFIEMYNRQTNIDVIMGSVLNLNSSESSNESGEQRSRARFE